MSNIQVIGSEIWFDGHLVAELIGQPPSSIITKFVDSINNFDIDSEELECIKEEAKQDIDKLEEELISLDDTIHDLKIVAKNLSYDVKKAINNLNTNQQRQQISANLSRALQEFQMNMAEFDLEDSNE